MFADIRRRIQLARFCTIHRRSLSAIQKWQSAEVYKLLQYASANVPMWQEILSSVPIETVSTQGIEGLQNIPLANKNTYIGRMVEEYIDGSRPHVPAWKVTSGSSGIPFRSLSSSASLNPFLADFLCYRFLLWSGRSMGNIAETKCAYIIDSTHSSTFRMGITYMDFREDPKKVYLQLADFKPEVLVSFPSVFLELAQMAEHDKRLPPLMPRYCLSTGDLLTPAMNDIISNKFGAEIYVRYALNEVGVVGTECSLRNGFHTNCESMIVEITDNSGKPLPEGSYGKVVVTDLLNYNMPFIRYDTGDRGKLSLEPCECGLRTPRVWLEGRVSTYLTFSGNKLYRHDFTPLDPFMHAILQYQVVKQGEHDLLLRIVPGPQWKSLLLKQIEECIQEIVPKDTNVSIECVSSISKAPRGKFNLLVDESFSPNISS